METTVNLESLWESSGTSAQQFEALSEAAFATRSSLNRFSELVARTEKAGAASDPQAAVKLGAAYLMLSDPSRALTWLDRAADEAIRYFLSGLAKIDLHRFAEAVADFEQAASKGWDALECDCRRAECKIGLDDLDGAQALIDSRHAEGSASAHWHYARGRLLQQRGETDQAIAAYEAALDRDPDHPHAMFHLAYLCDLHGSDERALELYAKCCELPRVYIHALINMAVLMEDVGDYDEAAMCLYRVLAVRPDHARAQLYLKDVLASGNMIIDEAQIKAREKQHAVLDIPISEFELSVRSRNCLKKMNINSLGDLLRVSEAELLSYKNFGETSLREIKAMLAQKGLSLGQLADKTADKNAAMGLELDPGVNPDVLQRPVASLEFSVRSRKCLQRLGITTVAELASHSEKELLESRNFGQTSLKEVKERLEELGLSLKSSEPRSG